jgi:hypothetical protein
LSCFYAIEKTPENHKSATLFPNVACLTNRSLGRRFEAVERLSQSVADSSQVMNHVALVTVLVERRGYPRFQQAGALFVNRKMREQQANAQLSNSLSVTPSPYSPIQENPQPLGRL